MKKALLFIVVVLFCATFVFAATSTKFTKYGNIFKTGDFTIKGINCTINEAGNREGDSLPVTIALKNGEYLMESIVDGNKAGVLFKNDGKLYMYDEKEKMAMIMPIGSETMMQFPPVFVYTKNGNGKFDGKNLYYETLIEGDKQTIYWYSGNDIYAIQEKGPEENYAIFISSITPKADPSLFVLPKDYEILDMNDLMSLLDSSWAQSMPY